MCLAHNVMFRTLNAITLQYAQLTLAADIADFLTYCQCFHEMVHEHHYHEETKFFPAIEAYSGEKGIMDTNLAQHHAFEEGMKGFGEYVYSVSPKDWDKETFRGILESFMPALTKHMREEIQTLLALDRFGGEKLKKAWDDMEKKVLAGAIDPVSLPLSLGFEEWELANRKQYRVLPIGLGSLDVTYAKDQQAPLPWFVPYLCRYWHMRRHRGAWRFSPCTVFGQPKELLFAVTEK
jgi:hemerythrin-like domain-containing protein